MDGQRHKDRFITAWYGLSNLAVDLGIFAITSLDEGEMIPLERMPEVYDFVVRSIVPAHRLYLT